MENSTFWWQYIVHFVAILCEEINQPKRLFLGKVWGMIEQDIMNCVNSAFNWSGDSGESGDSSEKVGCHNCDIWRTDGGTDCEDRARILDSDLQFVIRGFSQWVSNERRIIGTKNPLWGSCNGKIT